MEKLNYLYSFFKDPPQERFPTSKRRDYMVEAAQFLRDADPDPKEMELFQQKVSFIAQAIFSENKCSHSSARVLADMIIAAFEKTPALSPSSSAILLELGTYFFNAILTPKALTINLMSSLFLFSKIYSRFLLVLSQNILLTDLITALLKLYKKQTEWYVKERVLQTLTTVLEKKPSKLDASAPQIFKFISKTANSQKFVYALCALMRLLETLVSLLNPALLAQHFDLIANALLTVAEDSTRLVAVYVVRAFVTFFKRTGLNWSATIRKKIDMPRSLLELLDWLSKNSFFSKQVKLDSLRLTLLQALRSLFNQSKDQIQSYGDIVKLLEALLSFAERLKSKERKHALAINTAMAAVLEQIVALSTQKQKVELLCAVSGLMRNSSLVPALLELLTALIMRLDQEHLLQNLKTIQKQILSSLEKVILGQFFDVKLFACDCVLALGKKAPSLMSKLMLHYLNLTTLSNAELAAQDGSIHSKDVQRTYRQMEGCCVVLGKLFTASVGVLGGVPLDIAYSAFNAAKAMILGAFSEEGITDTSEDTMTVGKTAHRRPAGWLVIEGMITGLGRPWASSNLVSLFRLWSVEFEKEACTISTSQFKKSGKYHSRTLLLFDLKVASLAALRAFLLHHESLVKKVSSVQKAVAGFVMCACEYFLDSQKGEVFKAIEQQFPLKMAQFQEDLIESVLLIPNLDLIAPAYNPVLQFLSDVLVTSNVRPALWMKYTSRQDWLLKTEFTLFHSTEFNPPDALDFKLLPHLQFPQLISPQLPVPQNYYLQRSVRLTHFLYSNPLTFNHSHETILLDSSIQLLARIFTSNSIKPKNRAQVIRYFISKCVPSPAANPASAPVLGALTFRYLLFINGVARQLIPKKRRIPELIDSLEASVWVVIEDKELTTKPLLLTTACETLVLLLKSEIEADTGKAAHTLSRIADLTAGGTGQGQEHLKVAGALLLSNILRHVESSALNPFKQQIGKQMFTLAKDVHHTTRQVSEYLVFVAFKYNAPYMMEGFKSLFSQCYYQLIVDVREDEHVSSSQYPTQLQTNFFMLSGICLQEEKLINMINPVRVTSTLQFVLSALKQNKPLPCCLVSAALYCLRNAIVSQQYGISHPEQEISYFIKLLSDVGPAYLKTDLLKILLTLLFHPHASKHLLLSHRFQTVLLRELESAQYSCGLLEEHEESNPLDLFESEDAFAQTPNQASFLSPHDPHLHRLFTVKRVLVVYFKMINDFSHLVSLVFDVFQWLNKDSLDSDHHEERESSSKDVTKRKGRQLGGLCKDTAVFVLSLLQKKLEHVAETQLNIFRSKKRNKQESVIHNLPDLLRLISSGCSQTHDELKVTSLKLLATVIKKFRNSTEIRGDEPDQDDPEFAERQRDPILEQNDGQIGAFIRDSLNPENGVQVVRAATTCALKYTRAAISMDHTSLERLINCLQSPLEEAQGIQHFSSHFASEQAFHSSLLERVAVLAKFKLMAEGLYSSHSRYELFSQQNLDTLKQASLKVKVPLLLRIISEVANDLAVVLLLPKKYHKARPAFVHLNADSSAAFDRALFFRKLPTFARFAFHYDSESPHTALIELLFYSLSAEVEAAHKSELIKLAQLKALIELCKLPKVDPSDIARAKEALALFLQLNLASFNTLLLEFYNQQLDFSQTELISSQLASNFSAFPICSHSALIQLYIDYLSLAFFKFEPGQQKNYIFVQILLEPLGKLHEIEDLKMKRTVLQKVIEIARELPSMSQQSYLYGYLDKLRGLLTQQKQNKELMILALQTLVKMESGYHHATIFEQINSELYFVQLQALLRHPHYKTDSANFVKHCLPTLLTTGQLNTPLAGLLLELQGASQDEAIVLLIFDYLLEQAEGEQKEIVADTLFKLANARQNSFKTFLIDLTMEEKGLISTLLRAHSQKQSAQPAAQTSSQTKTVASATSTAYKSQALSTPAKVPSGGGGGWSAFK